MYTPFNSSSSSSRTSLTSCHESRLKMPLSINYDNNNNEISIQEGDTSSKSLEDRREYADGFLKAHGFEVVVSHGQRISTAPWWDEDSMRNVQWNEVFLGKLPRDMFEDELLYHLQQPGSVGRIRYMMDFSGYNRGYCFVKYATSSEAIKAILYLDNLHIRTNKPPIGAKISFDNKNLYIGNLPTTCTREQLLAILQKADVHGIVDIELNDSKSRRNYRGYVPASKFGYLHFESHEAATKARRILLPGDVRILGRKLTLDWAKSEIPAELVTFMKSYETKKQITPVIPRPHRPNLINWSNHYDVIFNM